MKNYVIIGNSAAGISCAYEIRKQDKNANITIISDEKGPSYSRCLLSYYISGQINKQKLIFKDNDFYKKNNIKLLDNIKATKINKKEKNIQLSNNDFLQYDKLLISTGASPRLINFNNNINGIFYLRTIEDAENILKHIDKIKSAAILGSGLIGIKIAYAFYKKNKNVHLIARSNRILSQMIDLSSAQFISEIIKNKINLNTGLDVKELIYNENNLKGLILSDNNKIDCEMIVIAKGVVPNTELAVDAGLRINNGIIVDSNLKTNDENIYAAGDVAETIDLITGESGIKALWTTAVEQGQIAGKNMIGNNYQYNGALSMNSIECFDLPCISSGYLSENSKELYDFRTIEPYALRRVFVNNNKIDGYITIGDIKFSGILNDMLIKKRDITKIKNKLNTFKLSRSDLLECVNKEEITSIMDKK